MVLDHLGLDSEVVEGLEVDSVRPLVGMALEGALEDL